MVPSTFLPFFILFISFISPLEGYSRGCEDRSCYPATGNLLIGREDNLTATSTCGIKRLEKYCIISHLDHLQPSGSISGGGFGPSKKCFKCDSSTEGLRNDPKNSHRIKNIVYRNDPEKGYQTWWQAENGVENVTIDFDLGAEFHVTHV